MVYQGKICTVQFTKLFSTSLPNSKIIQSKYELEFDDAMLRGLSMQPLLSPEFIDRFRRKKNTLKTENYSSPTCEHTFPPENSSKK